jgi:hypothetical protein
MVIFLRPSYCIEIRDELSLTLMTQGILEGIERGERIVGNSYSSLFTSNSLFSYRRVVYIAGISDPNSKFVNTWKLGLRGKINNSRSINRSYTSNICVARCLA